MCSKRCHGVMSNCMNSLVVYEATLFLAGLQLQIESTKKNAADDDDFAKAEGFRRKRKKGTKQPEEQYRYE